MELRDHPVMSYRGQKNWPPAWMHSGLGRNTVPRGEIGILKEVHISVADPNAPESIKPYNRIYLFVEDHDAGYVGALLFDSEAACRQIGKVLSDYCGKTLREIGGIDLSHLL